MEAFGQVLPASAVVRLRSSIACQPLPAPAPGAVPSYVAAEALRPADAALHGGGDAQQQQDGEQQHEQQQEAGQQAGEQPVEGQQQIQQPVAATSGGGIA